MEFARSLDDVRKILKRKDFLISGELLDELTGFALTAGTLISIIKDPTNAIQNLATGASISAVKPSNFLKYLAGKFDYYDKGRELSVKERYEKLSYINFILVHIAAKEAFTEIVLPPLQSYAIEGVLDRTLDDKLSKYSEEADYELLHSELNLPSYNDKFTITTYLKKIFIPIENIINEYIEKNPDKEKVKNIIANTFDRAVIIYNAFIVEFSDEFPEFYTWVDISKKENIAEYCNTIIKKTEEQTEFIKMFMEKLDKALAFRNNSYKEEFDFNIYEKLIRRQNNSISSLYDNPALSQVKEHHNVLKSYLSKKVSNDESIEMIKYPNNEKIYIPQSFKMLKYQKAKHQKNILLPSYWDEESSGAVSGEDIMQTLSALLLDPMNSFLPIIVLGNPGAGKSMFSSIFSAKLCDSAEYVPFLVKLRDIQSSNTDINDHIKQGLEKTIPGNLNINWISWIKEFNNRIPVFILDGFDELLQTSQSELYGYLLKIQELQQAVYDANGIVIKVIITSRLTIMQDVKITDETTIIKFDPFDSKRQKQWIKIWNSTQSKPEFKPFSIPNNYHIKELAKEPLLLFMLAVYDFEGNDLKASINSKSFNQAELYDKLFVKFAKRQLSKDLKYYNYPSEKQAEQQELFRLRLGLVALMMFLNDRTNHNCSSLKDELEQFGLDGGQVNPNEVFTGFFFIHENSSKDEQNEKIINFEFLHKTFGEFLAADFLLRVLKHISLESESKLTGIGTIRYIFGYNWLNKHPNIVKFLFEFSTKVISDSNKKSISKLIKNEIKGVFTKDTLLFPVNTIQLVNPVTQPVVNHLAMYSQNLVIMWNVLYSIDNKIDFNLSAPRGLFSDETSVNISNNLENMRIDSDISQDIDELDVNISMWKQLVALWNMVGNKAASAKLGHWVSISSNNGNLEMIHQNKEIKNYFLESALIGCNSYELLLAYNNADFLIEDIKVIIDNKPMLSKIVLDVLFNRFEYLINNEPENFSLFIENMMNKNANFEDLILSHKIIIKIIQYKLNPIVYYILKRVNILALLRNNELNVYDRMKIFVLFINDITLYNKRRYSSILGLITDFFESSSKSEKLIIVSNLEFTKCSARYLLDLDEYRNLFFDFIRGTYNHGDLYLVHRIECLKLLIKLSKRFSLDKFLMNIYYECLHSMTISEKLEIIELYCLYSEDRQVVDKLLKETYMEITRREPPRYSISVYLNIFELIERYSRSKNIIDSSIFSRINELKEKRKLPLRPGEELRLRRIEELYDVKKVKKSRSKEIALDYDIIEYDEEGINLI